MEWISIPDQLRLEANGFAWQEGEENTPSEARHFHLRYAYNYDDQSLYVDVIEDKPDGTSRILLAAGSHENMDTFHHAVAAIECAFPTSAVIKDSKFSRLAGLRDRYQDSYEEFGHVKKIEKNLDLQYEQEDLQKTMRDMVSSLFKAYEYAKKKEQGDPTLCNAFTNLTRVDFKSRKKAYKPEDDLLEQMRGAIGRMKNHDSPVTKIFGPKEPS